MTITLTELKSTDGELYVTTRKSISSTKPSTTVSDTVHSPPSKDNGDINHELPKVRSTREQEMVVFDEAGNGLQMLSESGKEICRAGSKGMQIDDSVLTERKLGEDKMGIESIFPKSKQSCNSSVTPFTKGQKIQIKVFENRLESNTGRIVLSTFSKDEKETKPNSQTVEGNEQNIYKKRDDLSDTCTGKNDNEILLNPLNPPTKQSSESNYTCKAVSISGTQQRIGFAQPFNYMAVSPDKVCDASNSAKTTRVKYTSDQIF
ncbi:hypothetical protein CHS0354_009795 [Potamilus streckersoni]|uniref:Uncharacterized protein n=1 Tax=Potamilus streckersoni TaxID=2493646 RepID=A0AAE0SR70_9BIVA|nr:hypothetical protein CHS0354_009795 [Potamilus streckersoni]